MKPIELTDKAWAELGPHDRQCVELTLAEQANRLAGGRPVDVWPVGWTDEQIKRARQAGVRVLDPRCDRPSTWRP